MNVQEERAEQFSCVSCGERFLVVDHNRRGEERKEAMAKITKHDGEKERERDDCIETRVDLLVGRDTITVDESLECLCKLVDAVECRRFASSAQFVQDRRSACVGCLLSVSSLSYTSRIEIHPD